MWRKFREEETLKFLFIQTEEKKFSKEKAGGRSVEEQHMALKGAQLEVAFPSEHDVRAADSLPSLSLLF